MSELFDSASSARMPLGEESFRIAFSAASHIASIAAVGHYKPVTQPFLRAASDIPTGASHR